MTDHGRRPTLRAYRGTVSVGLVLALAGLLFTANARLATGENERHPQDLGELAKVEASRVKTLSGEVDELRAQVEELTAEQGASVDVGDAGAVERLSVAGGRTAVSGPGVTVTLTDAPTDSARTERFSPDDLVVHQQDLQAVVNALWAGGAEAMALQDQRVIATTAFRCVGNVLSLGGRLYSPPYEVRAIGDPKALRAALFASAEIQTYLDYVDQAGLGWSLSTEDDLELPGSEGSTELRFATVPDGTEVF
ncbi:DUF881 domain-containing protein [Pengzhenrongella frigida]|uniref:DUF881 domain-containing protein n=1 Tax=Pengzhenrongella frigida TaxID=1259133 RepID=A0A4Q5N0Z5_9MICO|nr:DUF881 domain-containing protein [Cellulomonas sp. HLT2-17]RYV51832.1 DUF881 domain-containing protein [Cellulomonas sp. HLT2-17]